jgi:IS1 family transposase
MHTLNSVPPSVASRKIGFMGRLVGPLENISIPQETVGVEVTRAFPNLIDVSKPWNHEISVQIFSSSSRYPVAHAVINAFIFKRKHADGRRNQGVETPPRNPRLRSPDVIKSDGYFDRVWAIVTRQFQQVAGFDHNFWLHPRSLDINQGISTGLGGQGSRFRSLGLSFDDLQSPNRNKNSYHSCNQQSNVRDILRRKQAREIAFRVIFGPIAICIGCLLIYYDSRARFGWNFFSIWFFRVLSVILLGGGLGAFFLPIYWQEDGKCDCKGEPFHINTVPQKYPLTTYNYWGTVMSIGSMDMANVLPMEKQVAVISSLAEGAGIRQIERITGVHRDTIMRLGVRVGKGCQSLLDAKMRDLPCKHVQFDEIWGFIGKKERHVRPDDNPELGDVWTFCAIDSDTKLVPAFKCGKRDLATANVFVADVASRLRNRVQISSDALRAYVDAIEMNFGADVDFAQIIKTYVTDDSHIPERRFSAPEIVITEKKSVSGFPDLRLASTSHIERLNGTTRLHMRRLTRLTYAFSKKLENFEAATALHFAYYNFVKRHNTLRMTPAMAAGIERDFWTVGNLIEAVA